MILFTRYFGALNEKQKRKKKKKKKKKEKKKKKKKKKEKKEKKKKNNNNNNKKKKSTPFFCSVFLFPRPLPRSLSFSLVQPPLTLQLSIPTRSSRAACS